MMGFSDCSRYNMSLNYRFRDGGYQCWHCHICRIVGICCCSVVTDERRKNSALRMWGPGELLAFTLPEHTWNMLKTKGSRKEFTYL